MKIELFDTFNKKRISTHNSLTAAVKSQRKHLAAVKRANGATSYLTYAFRYADGTPVNADEITEARLNLDQAH